MAGVVNIFDSLYPRLLNEIPSPPKKLYYKGVLKESVFDNCLAVVGSRKMSLYGEKAIEKIFSVLSKDITIVSGFMYGVDAEAHRQAIKFGLKTIAVMPCGIDYIHPENQKDLYEKIIESSGLILSEFESLFKPKLWTYPRRNRIVAGLCQAVLIIEASSNSGSLITARMANLFGRRVFVIPGSIFSNLTTGKVQISNEFAKTIDSGLYINEFFNLKVFQQLGFDCKEESSNPILKILKDNPMTVDDLKKYLPLKNISQISTELTLLTISNLVLERGGVFYAC